MNNNEKDDFEIIFKEIHRMADEKIVSLANSPFAKVNPESIIKKCELIITEKFKKELNENFSHIRLFFDKLETDNGILANKLKSRVNEAEVSNTEFKLLEEEIEEIKQFGIKLFGKSDYENSYIYFLFLSLLEPNNSQHWLLRAMAEQNLGKFNEAFRSYGLAVMLSPKYLLAHIMLMKCLIAADKVEVCNQYYLEFIQNINSSEYEQDAYFASEINLIKNSFSAYASRA